MKNIAKKFIFSLLLTLILTSHIAGCSLHFDRPYLISKKDYDLNSPLSNILNATHRYKTLIRMAESEKCDGNCAKTFRTSCEECIAALKRTDRQLVEYGIITGPADRHFLRTGQLRRGISMRAIAVKSATTVIARVGWDFFSGRRHRSMTIGRCNQNGQWYQVLAIETAANSHIETENGRTHVDEYYFRKARLVGWSVERLPEDAEMMTDHGYYYKTERRKVGFSCDWKPDREIAHKYGSNPVYLDERAISMLPRRQP